MVIKETKEKERISKRYLNNRFLKSLYIFIGHQVLLNSKDGDHMDGIYLERGTHTYTTPAKRELTDTINLM